MKKRNQTKENKEKIIQIINKIESDSFIEYLLTFIILALETWEK